MNPKFKELYSYLKSNGLTDLDEKTFYTKYSDPSKSKEIHSYLKQNDMTDLDESSFHSAYFGGKKKEPTVLPSEQPKAKSSSATSVKKTGKPSVGSGKEPNSYQYKDLKVYDIDGVWHTKGKNNAYTPIPEQSQKAVTQVVKRIKDYETKKSIKESEKTLDIVNKALGQNGKQSNAPGVRKDQPSGTTSGVLDPMSEMSTKVSSKVKAITEVGLDANESQLKKVEDKYNAIAVQSKLKEKGYDVDVDGDLNSEKTIKAISKERLKDNIYARRDWLTEAHASDVDRVMNQEVNQNNIDDVVDYYNSKFNSQGYIFSSIGTLSGRGRRTLSVKYEPSPGIVLSEKDFDVLEFSNEDLKLYMKESMLTNKQRQFLLGTENEYYSDVDRIKYNMDLLKIVSDSPNKFSTDFKEDVITMVDSSKALVKMYEDISSYQESLNSKASKLDNLQKEYERTKSEVVRENILKLTQEILIQDIEKNKMVQSLKKAEGAITKISGKALEESIKDGNVLGYLSGKFALGFTSVPKMATSLAMEIMPGVLGPEYMMPTNQYNELKAKGLSDYEITDLASKELKRNILSDVEKGIVNVASLGTTTKEHLDYYDYNDITKAAGFLAESIGTSFSAGGNSTLQKIAFFAMSYNAIEEQMRGEEFDRLTEIEKKAISVPYGIAIGALEKFGFDIMKSGGKAGPLSKIVNNVIARSLTNLPKNATVEAIEMEINKEVSKMIAVGTLRIVNGALSEGFVEGTQQMAEISEKYIVNKVLGKDKETGFDYFKDVPDIYGSWDGFFQALDIAKEDAYYGALGGLLFSGAQVSRKTLSDAIYEPKRDEDFSVYSKSILDDNLRELIKNNVITKLSNGEISKDDAAAELKSIDEVHAVLSKIDNNLSIRDQRNSFNLLLERGKLEAEIKGKDENLVARQKERISEINNTLQNISKNAVQEQATSEVPVQPEAAVSEEVVEGESKTESEVATEEGKGQVTTREIVNRPATLSEFGGNKFDSPLKGDLYVEGQQVVFEDRESGRKYELGNVDQVMDTQIPGLDVEQENISITSSGQVSIDGTNWNIQTELPTQGIEYNPAGEVTRVSLKDDAGNTKMFDGQQAVDIAYQIELQKYQTEEQQQFINDLLEQDEEFQAATEFIKPTETKAVVEEEAAADTVQAEPTAEVDQEAEQLGQLLEAQNVDQQAESIPDRRVRKQVANAVKALAKIAPKVRFVVHEDERSYREATDEVKREQASNGTYDPKTKTIHINLSKANARTVAHETFHAILLDRVMSDEQAAKVTKRMIDAISARLDNDPALKRYLEDFASNYKENLKNEEKLAELVGKLADQYESQTETFKDIVNRWLNKLAQMFGLQEVTSEQEVMDLLNTIARKVARGKSIKDKDVSKIIGSKEVPVSKINNRFQADFSDTVSKLTFVYDKNGSKFKQLEKDGYITKDMSLSDFNGKYIFLHQPDAAFSGEIYKNGELLIEGKGGVFYPIKFHEDGYFWASTDTTAEKMASDLNAVMEQNGGTIFMALTSAPYDKLLSSTTASNGVLDLIMSKAFDNNFKLSEAQFKNAIRNAANHTVVKKTLVTDKNGNPILDKKGNKQYKEKPVGLGLKLPASMTVDQIVSSIKESLSADVKSFADRKTFTTELIKAVSEHINKSDVSVEQFGKFFSEGIQNKYFKGITKTGKVKVSATNMTQAISEMLTEPILKDGVNRDSGGQVYAILELNGKVKPVKSDKHESYPMAIQSDSDSKVKLHLLKDRENWFDVFEDFETGDIVTQERQKKVYPTSGVSVRGLRLNTDRKQISDRKQTESKIRRQEPVAGNKLFNDPIPEATEIAISYSKKSGIPYVNVEKITKLDENNSKAIAREFDKMKNDPTNPEVREAYEAMVKETIAQYEEITSKGYSVEINNNEPYSSSQDMISDVRDNKRMRIFSTESGFGDIEITEEQRAENPLLQRTKFKDKNGVPLLANDLFRFVHDFFGHAKMGNSFGPIGEENAWRVHSVMYSDLARRAMTSETRGQNSWVNFSGVNDNAFKLRDKARQLRKEGKKDQADKLTEKVYEQMSFAEQKVGLMPEWVSETNGRKQISDVVNRKQDKTASSIVSIARKNGFSEAAIQKYLRDKGFSAEEISRAMAINENVNIDQIFEQSEKDLLDKRKKAGFVKSLQYVWNKLFDRQSRIKSIISKTGKTERTWYGKKIQTDKKAQRAHDLLVTKAGARGYSNYRFKEADKKIFKGLSDKLRDEFDKMIYAKRIISINENRAERGLEAYRGKDGYSEAEARRDLSDMRLRLGDKKFADLERRAGEYFDVFEESLKHLYESGRINQGLYETLKDIEYSPITTIKYIIADNSSLDEINRQAEEFGVTREDIMSLTDSNENSVIMDSRWLMMMNLMSVESRAFENKMLRAFADSLSDSSADVKAALSEYIMFAKEDGTGAPVGFRRVNYFVDGKKKTLLVRSDVANQLLDVKNRSKGLETLGKLTGVKILRYFATGANPVFIISNSAIDFSNVLFFTDVYHPIKIIGGVQLSWDFMSKFLGKIAQTGKYKQLMKEYMENGGALDFLSSDGIRSLRDSRRITKGLNIPQKALLYIGSLMSYAGETSEISMRMAVFGKVKSDLIAKYQKDLIEQYKKNNNGKMPKGEDLDEIKKMPKGQDLEDILRSAAREGRETIDFAQGGEWSKNADLVAPYLNPAMQGLRKPLQYAVDNPVGFANSVIQGSLMAGSVALFSLSSLVSAFGGDDDDEEKAEKIKKALASVPKSDKAQYHIIFTGEKDKNGEYVYLRIKKLPLLSIATTWAEQIAYKHAIESLGGEYETNSMIETLEYSSPIIPNYRIVERNPLLAGVLGYAMNKNLFTGQDIFRQQSDKKIEPWAEGQYDNKVEPIYKWVGKHTGLSPIRTKYLVEKIITSPTTNPTVGVFYSTTSGMPMGEMWDDIKKSITENASKKLFRTTNSNLIKYAEEDKIKDEVMKLYTERYLKEEYVKSEVNKALDEGDGLTESQLEKLVVDNFDEVDQLKYFKKYYLYTKRRDIDQTTLDLFFEDDPKVAGFLLYERFGDEIDDDEMDQLVLASEALGGARIGKKTMYHYNEYIEMYKNKK